MSHHPATFCKNPDHINQLIRYLCLEESCTHHRLICNFCVRDSHRKHSIAGLELYIDPLARLGMNSSFPDREKSCSSFQDTATSIAQAWQKVNKLFLSQSKFVEQTILHQLTTLSQTFNGNLEETALEKMMNGKASEEEVEGYVKKIKFLGGKHCNDPEKLISILQFLKNNIDLTFQDLQKRLSSVFIDFQLKLKKYNFENPQICELMSQRQRPDLKERADLDRTKRSTNESEVKDIPSVVGDSQVRQISEEIVKIEPDLFITPNSQVHIGLQYQDGISEMKNEQRAKIRRAVVTCCKLPQLQLAKILALTNLEELEIYWYQLAKKQYILKIMNQLQHLKVFVLNCANEFDEECCRLAPKKWSKIRKLQYGWDFYNSLRQYDENIYFRLSPYTNRGCPLKTSVTRQMVVGMKRLQNVWLGDFMYFRPSNNEIPFKNLKEFTLGQTKGKYFRIPDKLCIQLKEMRCLLSLAILHVKIDERRFLPVLLNNTFLKTFVIEGCDDITDESLRVIAKNCNLAHLSIRQSKSIEGSPIWEMTNLSTLILVQCHRIKGREAMTGLRRMRYLTYINLYGNKWVDDLVIKEISSSEHFHTANLGRTSITATSLNYLAQMKGLKTLCIDCNKLSGQAIAQFARSVPSLEKISLWGLDGSVATGLITQDDLEAMAREWTLLSHISIRYCQKIDGSIFLAFNSLKFIQADRECISLEVQSQLEKRGIKLFLDIEKEIIDDDL